MVDIYDLLAATSKGDSNYLAEDPFYSGGARLAATPINMRGSTGDILGASLTQGLLSGFLRGYGRGHSRDTAFQDYKQNPILAQNPVYAQNAQRPEGWTPDTGRTDSILAILQDKQAKEDAARKEAILAKIYGPVETRKANLGNYEEEQKIKGKYNPSGVRVNVKTGDGIAKETIKTAGKSKAIIDEANSLANILDSKGENYLSYLGSQLYSGLDKEGVIRRGDDLADRVFRMRSGAAGSDRERDNLKAVIRGDKTANRKQAARFLRDFAQGEARSVVSALDLAQTGENSGLPGVRSEFQKVLEGKQQNTIVGPDGQKYRFID